MTDQTKLPDGIKRRSLLKSAAVVSGASLLGTSAFSSVAGARPGGPCHKGFDCPDEATYVKFEFIVEEDEETGAVSCYFEEETDTGLLWITDYETKEGEECEPISVEWELEAGYAVDYVMAFGGTDCDDTEDPDGGFAPTLLNNGGNQAAISNLQFCVEERTLPECPMYGTSRVGSADNEVEIWSIRYDSDSDEIVETVVGDIPDLSGNQNYPNGLAFDPVNEIWYFAEEGGILKTMNEDDCLGITVYNGGASITGGQDIAGATLYDGGYYFTPQGGDGLFKVELNNDGSVVEDSGSVTTENVRTLPVNDNTFGDIAADDDGVLYFSVNGAFFKVDLNDSNNDEVIVESSDRDAYAVLSQLAFDDTGTLWAHHAGTGAWRTVDVSDGTLSDVVGTTKTYTDLATCGTFELNCPE